MRAIDENIVIELIKEARNRNEISDDDANALIEQVKLAPTIEMPVEEIEMPICGECLCRVCANENCLGCDGCQGVVDTEEDCPNEFILWE